MDRWRVCIGGFYRCVADQGYLIYLFETCRRGTPLLLLPHKSPHLLPFLAALTNPKQQGAEHAESGFQLHATKGCARETMIGEGDALLISGHVRVGGGSYETGGGGGRALLLHYP